MRASPYSAAPYQALASTSEGDSTIEMRRDNDSPSTTSALAFETMNAQLPGPHARHGAELLLHP